MAYSVETIPPPGVLRMKVSPNASCPCGSGAKLKRCCGVAHRGRPVEPALLMRARYVAYAIGDVGFLIATTHPDGSGAQVDRVAWRRELTEYCRATRFTGLTVSAVEIEGDTGWVTFAARLDQGGVDLSFSERSEFRRVDGRWLYYAGAVTDLTDAT